jgi:hypothetical protein
MIKTKKYILGLVGLLLIVSLALLALFYNGEYVRFADGTQICIMDISQAANPVAWTFPCVHVATPRVITYITNYEGSRVYSVHVNSPTYTGCNLYRFVSTNLSAPSFAASAQYVGAISIGRWY